MKHNLSFYTKSKVLSNLCDNLEEEEIRVNNRFFTDKETVVYFCTLYVPGNLSKGEEVMKQSGMDFFIEDNPRQDTFRMYESTKHVGIRLGDLEDLFEYLLNY